MLQFYKETEMLENWLNMYLSHELELIHPGSNTYTQTHTTPFWRKAIHKSAKVGTYVCSILETTLFYSLQYKCPVVCCLKQFATNSHTLIMCRLISSIYCAYTNT